MHLEVIGIGGAGCRIAERIAERAGGQGTDAADGRVSGDAASESYVVDAFAFDTDPTTLEALSAVPESHRHRYGTATEGLDGDLRAGFDVGQAHVDELSRVVDQGTPSKAEAFLLVVGLGGATGGGAAPALAADLQELYARPVYVAGTLPTNAEMTREGAASPADATESGDRIEESDGAGTETPTRPLAGRNAVRTLDRLHGVADAVFPFDNEAHLRTDERLMRGRSRLNDEFAGRLGALFTLNERAERGEVTAERTIDASDLDRTFGDETVLATVGRAEQRVETASEDESLLGLGLIGGGETEPDVDTSEAVSAVETVVRKAVRGKLTADCDRTSATGALLGIGGPPAWLNRRAIADGRTWLEGETGARSVRGGDVPDAGGDAVFAVALLAGVEDVTRVEELREEA